MRVGPPRVVPDPRPPANPWVAVLWVVALIAATDLGALAVRYIERIVR
jgi:hypothetical protein